MEQFKLYVRKCLILHSLIKWWILKSNNANLQYTDQNSNWWHLKDVLTKFGP